MPTARAIAIQQKINKNKGYEDAISLSNTFKRVEVVSSGIMTFDKATGGGLVKGRIHEIFGPESAGKTTLMLAAIAAIHAADPKSLVAFIDVEHALDLSWAILNGVDIDRLLISQPNSGEQAFNIIDMLLEEPDIALIVIDSVPAMQPQESIDKIEDGESDNTIGAQAKLMSKGLRALNNKLSTTKTNAAIIFINQVRQKIGLSFGFGAGANETTPGGLALKFYSSIRMDIRKASTGDPKDKSNNKKRENAIFSRIKVIKNKVAPPFQSCEIYIHSGSPAWEGGPKIYGIDKITPLLEAAIELGIIELRGSNYYIDGKKVSTGKAPLFKLFEKPDFESELRTKVVAMMKKERDDMIADPNKVVDAIIKKIVKKTKQEVEEADDDVEEVIDEGGEVIHKAKSKEPKEISDEELQQKLTEANKEE